MVFCCLLQYTTWGNWNFQPGALARMEGSGTCPNYHTSAELHCSNMWRTHTQTCYLRLKSFTFMVVYGRISELLWLSQLHRLLKQRKLGYIAEALKFLFQNGSCETKALFSNEKSMQSVLKCHTTCPPNIPEYFCRIECNLLSWTVNQRQQNLDLCCKVFLSFQLFPYV